MEIEIWLILCVANKSSQVAIFCLNFIYEPLKLWAKLINFLFQILDFESIRKSSQYLKAIRKFAHFFLSSTLMPIIS